MEELYRGLMRGLELAGRDWRRIDRCLSDWEAELDRAAGRAEWSGEYSEFLKHSYSEILSGLQSRAVELEEYEWAAACLHRRERILGTVTDPSV